MSIKLVSGDEDRSEACDVFVIAGSEIEVLAPRREV